MANPFQGTITAAGGVLTNQMDAPFNQALIHLYGPFTGLSVTVMLSPDGGATFDSTAVLQISDYSLQSVYPLAIPNQTGSGSFALKIMQLSFYNCIQITANALGSGPVTVIMRTGSFDQGSPVVVPVGANSPQSLQLELVRVRMALSDFMSTDYASAIAASDVGKV